MRLPVELLQLLLLLPILTPADKPPYTHSTAYDAGQLGPYPNQTFASSHRIVAPRLNILTQHPNAQSPIQHSSHRGLYTLIGLRGHKVKASASGPVLLNARGSVAWFGDKWPNPWNVQVQEYKSARYLTFWSGSGDYAGRGRGYYYMLDSSYKEVLRIRAKNGLLGGWGDAHEFFITKQGTAVLVIYEKKKVDLSPVGGAKKRGSGWIWDCLFQEIDLDSRRVLFRWRASDFFGVEDSRLSLARAQGGRDDPWDWFHLNSIDKDDEGNYLLSARSTNSIMYISGRDGSVLWNLGGKRNAFQDLSDGGATNFSSQHDARWHGNNLISLFDNAADDKHRSGVSRGMLIKLDAKSAQKTATLVQQFTHPDGISSISQGNMQVLDNGNVLIGWGVAGAWTEFTPSGVVVEDVHFQPASEFQTGNVHSYRTFKMRWQGFPRTRPSLVVKGSAAHVSWNGATEVNHWVLQCVHKRWFVKDNDWSNVVSEEKQGFETVLDFEQSSLKKWVRVVAFDADGNTLGMTRTVDWRFARKPLPQAYSMSDPGSVIWYIAFSLVGILVLLRVMRRCIRRFYMWRKRGRDGGLMHKLLPTTKPPP